MSAALTSNFTTRERSRQSCASISRQPRSQSHARVDEEAVAKVDAITRVSIRTVNTGLRTGSASRPAIRTLEPARFLATLERHRGSAGPWMFPRQHARESTRSAHPCLETSIVYLMSASFQCCGRLSTVRVAVLGVAVYTGPKTLFAGTSARVSERSSCTCRTYMTCKNVVRLYACEHVCWARECCRAMRTILHHLVSLTRCTWRKSKCHRGVFWGTLMHTRAS